MGKQNDRLIASDSRLVELGVYLKKSDYVFTAVTPETHRLVALRRPPAEPSLRDVFGWNFAFKRAALPAECVRLMREANVLHELPDSPLCRSVMRFASLDGEVYAHSAYPTTDADSVFFGPDSYRFIRYLRGRIPCLEGVDQCVVDLGCGSGVGGIDYARHGGQGRVVLADINPKALRTAASNASIAGVEVQCVLSDLLGGIDAEPALILCNPPYMADEKQRTYRDGGGSLGAALSLQIVDEAIRRLSPGGVLLLYTGSAIVDGEDAFRAQALARLQQAGFSFTYEEIDVDVFGEELMRDAYSRVDRIAAVGLHATKPLHH